MRILLILLLSLSLLLANLNAPAQSLVKVPDGQKKQIEQMRIRVSNMTPEEKVAAIKALEARLQTAKKRVGLARMQRRQAQLETQIRLMEKELELLRAKPAQLTPAPAVEGTKIRPKAEAKAQGPGKERPRRKQMGLSAGYIAGIPGLLAELRFHSPLDLVRTSCRLGVGYAQGKDSDGAARKHALLVLDGIYRFNPPQARGLRSYFGAGINYDVYTTGQKSGGLGGQVFYGIEGGRADQWFLELGYGTIRTGFSPDYQGLTALVGYRF